MLLLQFDTTLSVSAGEKISFAETGTEWYTSEMETMGHVAVTIRGPESADVHLGRAVEGPLLFVDAEIRRGRSTERTRAFARTVMAHAGGTYDVPDENMNVVFTNQPGEAVLGVDRIDGE